MSAEFRIQPVKEFVDRLHTIETPIENVTGMSRMMIFRAYSPEGYEAGWLYSTFKTTKKHKFGTELYEEQDRYVVLQDIRVFEPFLRKGVGQGIVRAMEQHARDFKASRIEGVISPIDREDEPWLPDFYRKLGFEVTQKGEGDWPILKILSSQS